ncbi:MAG: hypothetical protein BWY09_02932 [Candidatus Hydrogenedentes bacterium ADurb.Bin179]|nr:MAG: hypothetical protein BWY09_02932 [Candidatus Hydrogenedentes bacterium ADurb.Bin179]
MNDIGTKTSNAYRNRVVRLGVFPQYPRQTEQLQRFFKRDILGFHAPGQADAFRFIFFLFTAELYIRPIRSFQQKYFLAGLRTYAQAFFLLGLVVEHLFRLGHGQFIIIKFFGNRGDFPIFPGTTLKKGNRFAQTHHNAAS